MTPLVVPLPRRTLMVSLLVPCLIAAATLHLWPPRQAADAGAATIAQRVVDETALTPPRRAILASDPRRTPHAISRTLARYVDAVPAGGDIKIETYFLGSSITYPALVRAFHRGVHVQVILNGSTRGRYRQGPRLADLLNADRTDGSWVVFTDLSARGPDGVLSIDHDKVWRFSQVGDRRWVSVVGSYNNSDESDHNAFSMMWSLALKPVYDAIETTFQESRRDERAGANPMRSFRGDGWSSYVLPSTVQTAAADPVMKALRSIPARRGTVLKIAMFTMWDSRGEWIAERLARMARAGARIVFVSGPLVGRIPRSELDQSGVRVEGGCWPSDGTYVHDKAMSASYVDGGTRRYWTWIGSDNWTTRTMSSDQTVVAIAGRGVYRRYGRLFEVLTRRPDADPDRCHMFDE